MSKHKLAKEIVRRSHADTWDRAKVEWHVEEIFRQEEPDTCLCGHFPINEICVLRNSVNGEIAEVGNRCVKNFLGLESGRIFQALHRIIKDDGKALNAESIQHAFARGWINAWEKEFYFDTMRKRNLTDKQLRVRKKINKRVIQRTSRMRRGA